MTDSKSTTPAAGQVHAHFWIALLGGLAMSGCAQGGKDTNQANEPIVTTPPPVVEDAACWDDVDDIDNDLGCYSASFDVFAGDLQLYRVEFEYPGDVSFTGFAELGPPGTAFGSLAIDVDIDDVSDLTVVFASLGDAVGYADALEDGEFSPDIEPTIEHVYGRLLRVTLPYGGDGNPMNMHAPAGARLTLRIRDELFEGDTDATRVLDISGETTSVDPESGDFDDGAGAAPIVTSFTTDISRFD